MLRGSAGHFLGRWCGQMIGTVLSLVLGSFDLACAASPDLRRLVERRVRIQSPTLGARWHEGLFNRLRREPPCYVVLTFKPRPSSDAPLQSEAIVSLRDVSHLEAYTGRASNMSEWAGRQHGALALDAAWQSVSADTLDANNDCLEPITTKGSSPPLEELRTTVRVSMVQDDQIVTRDISTELQLQLRPVAHARIEHFGWTVSVTERTSGLEARNLLYHSQYFHGPYPTDVLAWSTHAKLFPDKRVLPVYGHPWEIRIRLVRPVAEAAGDSYRFVSGELEVEWRRLLHPNPLPE